MTIQKTFLIYILMLVAFGIYYFFARIKSEQSRSALEKDYLEKFPNAVKVYLTQSSHITSEIIEIHSVNGEIPAMIKQSFSSLKKGFYCNPGKAILELSWEYTRPGFFYKKVTKYTDVTEVEVFLEKEKEYFISYTEKEGFKIKEI